MWGSTHNHLLLDPVFVTAVGFVLHDENDIEIIYKAIR